jgi:hypothetical protein
MKGTLKFKHGIWGIETTEHFNFKGKPTWFAVKEIEQDLAKAYRFKFGENVTFDFETNENDDACVNWYSAKC